MDAGASIANNGNLTLIMENSGLGDCETFGPSKGLFWTSIGT